MDDANDGPDRWYTLGGMRDKGREGVRRDERRKSEIRSVARLCSLNVSYRQIFCGIRGGCYTKV